MGISSLNNENIRTLGNDPQYFGAYLNLALLNIYSINNHLAKEFKQSELQEDGHIRNSFVCNKEIKGLNYHGLFEKLVRLMPIVKQFDASRLLKERKTGLLTEKGKDIEKMTKTLKAVFDDVQEFRNDYTHYYSTEKENSRKLSVSNTTAEFLKTSFARAVKYTKSRFADVLSEADFSLVSQKEIVLEGNVLTPNGLVFLTSIFLDRENAFQFIGKIKGLKGTQFKSFIATREVLMAYCIKWPHDKLINDKSQQSLLLDMLNELNRCPKTLYNVLSENARKEFCPILSDDSLENVLKNSLNDEERERTLDNLDYQDYIEQLTARIRHSNRFFYHAMRFIDEQNLLPDFYFQIDLGKYCIAQYEKLMLGEKTLRSVVENPKAFGRLNDFSLPKEVERKINPNGLGNGFEQFAPHYNADINKIGISFKPLLPIVIPCKEREEEKSVNVKCKIKQPQPEAFLSLHELGKIILLEYLQPGESRKLIHQFITTANKQLFSIEFIELIKKKLPSDWKPFQKQCDTKKKRAYAGGSKYYPTDRKEALDVVLAPYGLNQRRIPERILNYWLNIKDVDDARTLSQRILSMRREGMKRLKQLEKHKKDPRIKIPKVGEMATFVVRDIIEMIIDREKKDKITSMYYDKLQECLAFYANPERKLQFIGLVHELGLNTPGGHPFLKKLCLEKISKTSEVYQLYLEEKVYKRSQRGFYRNGKPAIEEISWMTQTFCTRELNERPQKEFLVFKFPEEKSVLPYSIRQWEERERYGLCDWLRNVNDGRKNNDRKRPIDLPTNLFDDKIRELLSERLRAAGRPTSGKEKWNELFKLWWKTRNDSMQSFYQGDRCYMIKDEAVCFVPGSQPQWQSYFQEALDNAFDRLSKQREREQEKDKRLPDLNKMRLKKTFNRILSETEKEIRLIAEQDCISLLMAEQLSQNKDKGHLKLNNIKTELDRLCDIRRIFSYVPNYDEQGNKPEQGTTLTKVELTITATMKLKNIKDLNRFVCDRRLPEFVAYLPDATIEADHLRRELTDYNKARQRVFDAMFQLEKTIIEKDKPLLLSLNIDNKGNPSYGNIQHKPYLEWLMIGGYITEKEKVYLNMIRNCFSHNQFPHRAIAWNNNKEKQCNIASLIALEYKQKIETIIDKINEAI